MLFLLDLIIYTFVWIGSVRLCVCVRVCIHVSLAWRSVSLGFTLSLRLVLGLLLHNGYYEVVLGHQVVLDHKACEAMTQERLVLILVEDLAMVKVGVGEYPVDPSAN